MNKHVKSSLKKKNVKSCTLEEIRSGECRNTTPTNDMDDLK